MSTYMTYWSKCVAIQTVGYVITLYPAMTSGNPHVSVLVTGGSNRSKEETFDHPTKVLFLVSFCTAILY